MQPRRFVLPIDLKTYRWYILAFHLIVFITLGASLLITLFAQPALPLWKKLLTSLLLLVQGGVYIRMMIFVKNWPLSYLQLGMYFGINLPVWMLCTWLNPTLWWVGCMYIGQMFGLLHIRWALPTSLLVIVFIVVIGFDLPALSSQPMVAIGLFFQMGALLLVMIYINHLIQASQERGRLVEELQAAQKELEIARQKEVELATLRERERLGRDLHDSLGHALVAISVQLEAIQRLYRVDPQAAAAQLEQLKQLTRQSMDELRRSLAGLRTPGLGERSLSQGLDDICRAFQGRTAQELHLEIEPAAANLSPILAETCFRVVEEALTNIEKHAHSTQVQVHLGCSDHLVKLRVQDNGVGYPPGAENQPAHFGLRGMRERVEGLGGQLVLQNQAGAALEVVLPHA